MGVLKTSNLDLLYKATQYTHILDREGKHIVTENCGIVTANKGNYDSLPDGNSHIQSIRTRLMTNNPDLRYEEGRGTLDALVEAIRSGMTNIVVIKVADNQWHWFNLPETYDKVFPKLAKTDNGYYPDLFV